MRPATVGVLVPLLLRAASDGGASPARRAPLPHADAVIRTTSAKAV